MSNALFDFFSFFYFVVSLGIITLEYQNRRTKQDHCLKKYKSFVHPCRFSTRSRLDFVVRMRLVQLHIGKVESYLSLKSKLYFEIRNVLRLLKTLSYLTSKRMYVPTQNIGRHVLNIQFNSSLANKKKVKHSFTNHKARHNNSYNKATRRNAAWFPLFLYAQLSQMGLDHTMMLHVHVEVAVQQNTCWFRMPDAKRRRRRPWKAETTKAYPLEGWQHDYSGIFIGGSRLSTRILRSKSLSSNFFRKGWFCENINANSAQLNKKPAVRFIRNLNQSKRNADQEFWSRHPLSWILLYAAKQYSKKIKLQYIAH